MPPSSHEEIYSYFRKHNNYGIIFISVLTYLKTKFIRAFMHYSLLLFIISIL